MGGFLGGAWFRGGRGARRGDCPPPETLRRRHMRTGGGGPGAGARSGQRVWGRGSLREGVREGEHPAREAWAAAPAQAVPSGGQHRQPDRPVTQDAA